MPLFFGSSRKVGESKQGLRRSTKKLHAEGAWKCDQLNREKGSRGDFVPFRLPLAGSRDSVPCGVWGNAPTVPRATSMPNALNKGAGSEASLPVTLRVRRRASKLLFPQDSVKNRKNLRNTAAFRRKKDVYIDEVTSSIQSLDPSAAQPRRQQPPALHRG